MRGRALPRLAHPHGATPASTSTLPARRTVRPRASSFDDRQHGLEISALGAWPPREPKLPRRPGTPRLLVQQEIESIVGNEENV
jgi:hypothetical protein